MKVWIIVIKAADDATADGVTDELCSGQVFRRLERAKKECEKLIQEDHTDQSLEPTWTTKIEWAEVTEKGKPRRFIGRPKMDTEETFELHQAEVV